MRICTYIAHLWNRMRQRRLETRDTFNSFPPRVSYATQGAALGCCSHLREEATQVSSRPTWISHPPDGCGGLDLRVGWIYRAMLTARPQAAAWRSPAASRPAGPGVEKPVVQCRVRRWYGRDELGSDWKGWDGVGWGGLMGVPVRLQLSPNRSPPARKTDPWTPM